MYNIIILYISMIRVIVHRLIQEVLVFTILSLYKSIYIYNTMNGIMYLKSNTRILHNLKLRVKTKFRSAHVRRAIAERSRPGQQLAKSPLRWR